MLSCEHLSFGRNGRKILRDTSFSLGPKECIGILGASGSGKTVLLHLISGFLQPEGGRITVDGIDLVTLPPEAMQLYRSRVALVEQEAPLFEHLTVAQNVAYPLFFAGYPDEKLNALTGAMLRKAGLEEKAQHSPSTLARGDRMLVQLARACVGNARIILADEPFTPLDSLQRDAAEKLLKDALKSGASVLLTSQDPLPVRRMGGTMLHLQDGMMQAAKEQAATTAPAPALEKPTFRVLDEADDIPLATIEGYKEQEVSSERKASVAKAKESAHIKVVGVS